MMQANLSNALLLHRILEKDLVSWYKKFCCHWLEVPDTQTPHIESCSGSRPPYTDLQSLLDMEFPKFRPLASPVSQFQTIAPIVAFMMAYLLVVVIKVSLLQVY